MKEKSDTKIYCYIAGGFLIFACLGIIPWFYGWYRILMG